MPATLIYSSVANYISLYQLFSLDLPTFYSPTAAPPPKKEKKIHSTTSRNYASLSEQGILFVRISSEHSDRGCTVWGV